MKYSVLIQYDEVDKIYIASVPELEGCMAHGNTREEAVREVQAAIELYLEVVEESEVGLAVVV
ncbi:MAG: type II toxin-antitoxin system HicB family antitoxin [Defluviitaleaceae bacterium]|nr:type II toxin-antitoxin system HicB family antitoxin [Defluviitaleaceae bacterium]